MRPRPSSCRRNCCSTWSTPSGAVAKQPQPNPLLDNVEALALGEHLPGGQRQLYLMSDDNNGATQITRLYSLAVDLR
jgi:hypothetical protein